MIRKEKKAKKTYHHEALTNHRANVVIYRSANALHTTATGQAAKQTTKKE
jgi:hypothetical protein